MMNLKDLALGAFLLALAAPLQAEDIYGLKSGAPEIASISAMAFGPDGILFVGDSKSAQIFAIASGDPNEGNAPLTEVDKLSTKIAKTLDVMAESIKISDLAVNPATKNVYISVETPDAKPAIFQVVNGQGELRQLDLSNIPFSSIALPNAAEDKEVTVGNRTRNNRTNAITDLSFANGQLLVAGLSNEKAASNVWSLKFPFQEVDQGTSLEFYHAAHGRSEDYAPIRTFVPFIVNGEPSLLAGFVCTPLVRFPLTSLSESSEPSAKVQGTTLAELGNRNQPLDMIAYKKDGKDFLLLSNSARGVMKISTDDIAREEGITNPVPDGNTAGQEFEKVEALSGTLQMDKLDESRGVVLIQTGKDPVVLKVIDLP
ncbi:hypothetical protein SH668x_003631 [Planctomicrobium sp. SH668]|uniref:hypothetical protein n=1 Tax=Planctomicrobium sp. SH668 TaxID=3448126 RepID=UPI003F5CBBB6